MVNKVQASKGKNISMTIKTPEDINELKEQLSLLEEHENRFMMGNKQKPSFFKKISTFFSKKH